MKTLHSRLDKPKLLERIQTEYAFAERTLAQVPANALAEPGVCDY